VGRWHRTCSSSAASQEWKQSREACPGAVSSSFARGPLDLPDVLARAIRRLVHRLAVLEVQLEAGEESAWTAYLATLETLVQVIAQTAPGGHGALLTTAEMAARLGLSAKTLLKHRKNGAITPALQRGKLVRWRGTETVR
jgi:hypothetical protein